MRTLKYIGRRLLILVPQLFLISIITFTLVRMLPGDPARLELGPLAPQEGVELLRHQLRLDKPLPQQYIAYLQRLLHGDFGRSWVNSSPVAQDLLVRAPATLELITAGMLIVLVVMVPIALLSASPSRRWLARATRRISFGYGLLAGASGEHFVQGDPERIEVAPGIDRTVHSSSLFGRHVGERPRDELGRFR